MGRRPSLPGSLRAMVVMEVDVTSRAKSD